MQVDFSHRKYSLFPPIWSLLIRGKIVRSVGKLSLKMTSKHKCALFPPLFGFSAEHRFPIGSST